ncbi:polysaccharide deacetylase family protein [Chitinophaga tropicalis]|uniref:NodB homology domain-containing protein n=1 Tax=Chitinophaga tropicalis TaxID=2683588 RepID=A0A7K1U9H5_9BACT|nr:polysaccharide deacetylase family protein [Chitinophaga tropicalis]MVT10993.1 hypothetical protein [Chitinophaga tropicalis]
MKAIPQLLVSMNIAVSTPSVADHQQLQPGLNAILELFARYRVRATFFVTPAWAEHNPDQAQQLASCHELGIYVPEGAAENPVAARNTLQRITGTRKIYGFRGPGVKRYTTWKEAGYVYHSGIPAGWLNNRELPRTMYIKDSCFVIPSSVSPVLRYPLGWPGIWYMPELMTRYLGNRILNKDRMLSCNFDLQELSTHSTPFPLVIKRLDGFLAYLQGAGSFSTHIEWLQEQLYE